jgi:hypothetical protein
MLNFVTRCALGVTLLPAIVHKQIVGGFAEVVKIGRRPLRGRILKVQATESLPTLA